MNDTARTRCAAGEHFREERIAERFEPCPTRTEQHAFGLGQAEDRFHRVLHGVDEARRTLRRLLKAAV